MTACCWLLDKGKLATLVTPSISTLCCVNRRELAPVYYDRLCSTSLEAVGGPGPGAAAPCWSGAELHSGWGYGARRHEGALLEQPRLGSWVRSGAPVLSLVLVQAVCSEVVTGGLAAAGSSVPEPRRAARGGPLPDTGGARLRPAQLPSGSAI